jgi:regulatory protein
LKKKFSTADIQTTISSLKKQGLINDQEFVKLFVNDRLRFKPRSVFLITRELEKLGVSKDIIQEYFEQQTPDEIRIAIDALQKKQNTLHFTDKKNHFKKAISYLLRKGFSYSIAKQAYESIFTFETDT